MTDAATIRHIRADNTASRTDCCGRLALDYETATAGTDDVLVICPTGRGCRRRAARL